MPSILPPQDSWEWKLSIKELELLLVPLREVWWWLTGDGSLEAKGSLLILVIVDNGFCASSSHWTGSLDLAVLAAETLGH